MSSSTQSPPNFKAGDFAYQRGFLGRLDGSHPNPGCFGFNFVQYVESDRRVIGGGSACATLGDLSHVTNPRDVLICRVFAAQQAAHDARVEESRQARIAEINLAAIAALEDAIKAAHQNGEVA